MSDNYLYQIAVAGIRKIEGVDYVDGDTFPYDPANLAHQRLLEQGLLRVELAETPATTTARSKSKSSRSKSK